MYNTAAAAVDVGLANILRSPQAERRMLRSGDTSPDRTCSRTFADGGLRTVRRGGDVRKMLLISDWKSGDWRSWAMLYRPLDSTTTRASSCDSTLLESSASTAVFVADDTYLSTAKLASRCDTPHGGSFSGQEDCGLTTSYVCSRMFSSGTVVAWGELGRWWSAHIWGGKSGDFGVFGASGPSTLTSPDSQPAPSGSRGQYAVRLRENARRGWAHRELLRDKRAWSENQAHEMCRRFHESPVRWILGGCRRVVPLQFSEEEVGGLGGELDICEPEKREGGGRKKEGSEPHSDDAINYGSLTRPPS
ncbi:hypothetical protein FB451DRAFT_1460627 [Mycena latifolia]|nr:hypothetical protein FB451DRAFT_1460627 [Mycena latifolia]